MSAPTANHLIAFASFQWHAVPTYWAYLFFLYELMLETGLALPFALPIVFLIRIDLTLW